MKSHRLPLLLPLILLTITLALQAHAETIRIGGDTILSDSQAESAATITGDAFIAGFSATLSGPTDSDAHVAGFSVNVDATIGADLYAVGGAVDVTGSIGDDLTASGFSIHVLPGARVGGNARLAGGTVTIEAPIEGSLLVGAGAATLDAPVAGDVRVASRGLSFGEKARIGGTLTYSVPEQLTIPASVIPADRVRYMPQSGANMLDDLYGTVDDSVTDLWPSLVSVLLSLLVVLAFLLLLAAICLGFAPRVIDRLEARTVEHAWFALLFGFIGFSTVLGAIPASAITIIGLPFIPFLLLAILLLWTLGYLLGLHVVMARVAHVLGVDAVHPPARLLLLAVGLVLAGLINFIPVAGWIVNLGVMLFGLGAMTIMAMQKLVAKATASPKLRLPTSTSPA